MIGADDEIRVVVITSAGDKASVTGGDISAMAGDWFCVDTLFRGKQALNRDAEKGNRCHQNFSVKKI